MEDGRSGQRTHERRRVRVVYPASVLRRCPACAGRASELVAVEFRGRRDSRDVEVVGGQQRAAGHEGQRRTAIPRAPALRGRPVCVRRASVFVVVESQGRWEGR